jgi:hypothetical protein
MNKLRLLASMLFCAVLPAVIFIDCGDSGNNPGSTPPTPDHFPFSRNYVWTFRTNVFAVNGLPDTTFELKIDTATYGNGMNRLYWWYFIRIPGISPNWQHFWVMLDSANTIYSWGDFPNGSPPFSMGWRHQYSTSEGTRETITVQGHTYNAIRVDYTGEKNVTISWWFADGIGLIREYSAKGGSIFEDDSWGTATVVNTELISYTH